MIKVFISYSHTDFKLRKELEKHLSNLQRNNQIDGWSDRQINAGDEWDEKIKKELYDSQIILFLISPDFINSKYINDTEVKVALERYDSGKSIIVPIYLRFCDWQNSVLGRFQALPKKEGKLMPVKKWQDIDEAFYHIIQGLKKILNEFYQNTTQKQLEIVEKENFIGKFNRISIDPWRDLVMEEEQAKFLFEFKSKYDRAAKLIEEDRLLELPSIWEDLIYNKMFSVNYHAWENLQFYKYHIHDAKAFLMSSYQKTFNNAKNFDYLKRAISIMKEIADMTPYTIGENSENALHPYEAIDRNTLFIKDLSQMKNNLDNLKAFPDSLLGLETDGIYKLNKTILEKIQATNELIKKYIST